MSNLLLLAGGTIWATGQVAADRRVPAYYFDRRLLLSHPVRRLGERLHLPLLLPAGVDATSTLAELLSLCGGARVELVLSPRHRTPRDRGGTTSSCTASFSPSRRASRHPAPKSPLVPLPPTGSSTEPPPCVSLLPKLPPSCRLPPLQLPRDRRPSCLPTKLPPSRRPPPKTKSWRGRLECSFPENRRHAVHGCEFWL